jgi:hypothetical protein
VHVAVDEVGPVAAQAGPPDLLQHPVGQLGQHAGHQQPDDQDDQGAKELGTNAATSDQALSSPCCQSNSSTWTKGRATLTRPRLLQVDAGGRP